MNLVDPFLVFPLLGTTVSISWLTLFGLVGSALFSLRVFIQWIASERQKRSVVPVAFWWVSLAAALIQMLYFIGRHDEAGLHDPDLPMILGLSVTFPPYIRSLRIHYRPGGPRRGGWQIYIPAAALILVVIYGAMTKLQGENGWLFTLGLFGAAIYNSRFIAAWIRSEATREATLPLSFWYLSMAGSFILLAYGLLQGDLVIIISFLFNSIPYLRNILLLKRQT